MVLNLMVEKEITSHLSLEAVNHSRLEDHLVGHAAGETVEVNGLPEDCQATDLAR